MSRPASCQRFEDLMDRWVRDGEPYGPREEAFFEEHRRSCSDCALSVRLVEEMQRADSSHEAAPPGSQALRVKARQVLLADESRDRPSPGRTTGAGVAVAGVVAVAVAAAAVLGLVLLRVPQGEVPPVTDPSPEPVATLLYLADDPPMTDRAIAAGTAVHLDDTLTADRGSLFLRFADSSTTYLEEGTSASLVTAGPETTRMELERGRVFVHVMPRREGETFAVDVPGGQILVIGTVFSVSCVDDDLEVSVAEGLVRLELTGGSAVEIPAGQVYRTGAGLARLSEESLETIDRAARLGEPPALQFAFHESMGMEGLDDTPPAALVPRTSTVGQGSGPAARTKPGIPGLLQAARESRFNGDWTGAATAYQDLIAAYPDSPEALTCLVPLGQLQLQQLGQPEAALTSFSHYARNASQGALLEEAEWGIAQCLRELGRVDDEHLTLTVFRDHHPDSVYAAEVQVRLEQLEAQR